VLSEWAARGLRWKSKGVMAPLRRAAGAEVAPAPMADKGGISRLRPEAGRPHFLGLVLLVGPATSLQMRGLARFPSASAAARLCSRCGRPLISDGRRPDVGILHRRPSMLCDWAAAKRSPARLVACTGNARLQVSAAKPQGHGAPACRLSRVACPAVDLPINIHLTGCPTPAPMRMSCYVGLLACKVDQGGNRSGLHV